MTPLRLLPLGFLLLASGCAYDSYAQGYAPPGSYDQGYAPSDGYDQGYGGNDGFGYAETNVPSVEVFYDRLAPYGRWVNSRHGRVWSPNVERSWRPYTLGRWGENRYWMSDEPFGWATYHYGRWAFDARDGWLWIPGTEWAPSWVAWRDADDYAGWAPLPPGLSVSIGVGFGYGYDNYNSWYEPSWVWVPRPYLYQPRFGGRIVHWDRGRDFWGRSHWQQRPEWRGRHGDWQGHGGHGWSGRPRGDGNWQGRPHGDRDGVTHGHGRDPGNLRPDGIRQPGTQGDRRPDQPGWQGRGPGSVGGNPGAQMRQAPPQVQMQQPQFQPQPQPQAQPQAQPQPQAAPPERPEPRQPRLRENERPQ